MILAALGDVFVDIRARSDSYEPNGQVPGIISMNLGGAAANLLVAAHTAGVDSTELYGHVGSDSWSQWICDQLSLSGVVQRLTLSGSTGVILCLEDDTKTLFVVDFRGQVDHRHSLESLSLQFGSWLHLSGYWLLNFALSTGDYLGHLSRLATACRKAKITVSADLGNVSLLEAVGAEQVDHLLQTIRPALVFLSRSEEHWLSKASVGIFGVPAVVVTDGARPIRLVTGDAEQLVAVDALPSGVSTVGAGDWFAGTVIASLCDGISIVDALKLGADSVAARFWPARP